MELLQQIQLVAIFAMVCVLLLHYFRCINIPQTPLKKKKKALGGFSNGGGNGGSGGNSNGIGNDASSDLLNIE